MKLGLGRLSRPRPRHTCGHQKPMKAAWRQQQGFIACQSRQAPPTASCLTRQAALGATLLSADHATAHAIAVYNLLLLSILLVGLRQLVHPLPASPAPAALKYYSMQRTPGSNASSACAYIHNRHHCPVLSLATGTPSACQVHMSSHSSTCDIPATSAGQAGGWMTTAAAAQAAHGLEVD